MSRHRQPQIFPCTTFRIQVADKTTCFALTCNVFYFSVLFSANKCIVPLLVPQRNTAWLVSCIFSSDETRKKQASHVFCCRTGIGSIGSCDNPTTPSPPPRPQIKPSVAEGTPSYLLPSSGSWAPGCPSSPDTPVTADHVHLAHCTGDNQDISSSAKGAFSVKEKLPGPLTPDYFQWSECHRRPWRRAVDLSPCCVSAFFSLAFTSSSPLRSSLSTPPLPFCAAGCS